jgi:hypothetical protein
MHVLHVKGEHSDLVTRHWPLLQDVLQPVVQEDGGGGEAAARRAALVVEEIDATAAAGGGDSVIAMVPADGNCALPPVRIQRQTVITSKRHRLNPDTGSHPLLFIPGCLKIIFYFPALSVCVTTTLVIYVACLLYRR